MIGWGRVLTAGEVPMPGSVDVWQFRRQARGCLSYLVHSRGAAVVVDPAPAVEAYERAAAALGSEIVAVFDTHIHADHLSGARELAARAGAPLKISVRALERGIADPERFEPVSDGEQLGIRGLRVLALPGHTSDMTGLVVEGAALIAGDSLFADSVARPDLEVGDEGAEEAAAQLLATLQVHVLTLPPSTLVLPCHYPGGRLAGPVAPTLAGVRTAVPELELPAVEFVRRVLRSMPPRPANYERIIEVNLGRGGADPDEDARLEVGANNCAVSSTWAAAS
jgi:glyoxylase-like metal-dependent hydrolase (beta-lactamase superfamily II)